jgi:hypothetical protein
MENHAHSPLANSNEIIASQSRLPSSILITHLIIHLAIASRPINPPKF